LQVVAVNFTFSVQFAGYSQGADKVFHAIELADREMYAQRNRARGLPKLEQPIF
jgi:hypothetical protein